MHKIYTIGFTRKSLEIFIKLLQKARITLVVDIRLNNTSQLAGYSKGKDLEFLLNAGFGITYRHELQLAPTEDILNQYKKDNNWNRYENDFLKSLEKNKVSILKLGKELMKNQTICLLCTEPTVDKCHRRLIAEFWAKNLPDIEVYHL
ncbi:MAG: DUF488 domain-containing protein [bacterium]